MGYYLIIAAAITPREYEEKKMANGITINEGRVTCNNCGRWEWESSGKNIRHSTRCDTPNAQLTQAAQPEPRTSVLGKYSQDSPASGHTTEEINRALYLREISESDAMNTDF